MIGLRSIFERTTARILRRVASTLIAVLAVAVSGAHALASGDIVYSARYYAPVGSRYFTHFHLYRINPDGTGRRQITVGRCDDYDPKWSADGRRVLFVRQFRGGSKIMECASDGRRLGTIAVLNSLEPYQVTLSANGDYVVYGNDMSDAVTVITDRGNRVPGFEHAQEVVFSPAARHAYVRTGTSECVVDTAGRVRIGLSRTIDQGWPESVAWLNDSRFAGLVGAPDNSSVDLLVFDLTGRVVRRVHCTWNGSRADPGAGSIDSGGRGLATHLAGSSTVDYIQDIGNSGDRPDNDYYLCSSETGETCFVCEGQFLVWNPDGTEFCSATEHELAPYDKVRDLYTAQLFIGKLGSDRKRVIVSGMIWVTGADWR